jgi:hypothetical protein
LLLLILSTKNKKNKKKFWLKQYLGDGAKWLNLMGGGVCFVMTG